MFGVSFEHLVILFVVLLIFGPRRLPELGITLGKAMRNFKDALAGVEEARYRKIDDQDNEKQPHLSQNAQKPMSPSDLDESAVDASTDPEKVTKKS